MAEIQNLTIDQANTKSSIRELAQGDSGQKGRPNEAKEEKKSFKSEAIEDRVEITPNALKQTEASDRSRGTMLQPKTFRTDKLAEKTYGKDGGQADSVIDLRRDAEKDVKEGFQKESVQLRPVVSNQAEAPSPTQQRAEVSKALEAGFKIGNTQTDPTVMQKFAKRNMGEGAGALSVVQQRGEHKEALADKNGATAVETERGQNVSKMI